MYLVTRPLLALAAAATLLAACAAPNDGATTNPPSAAVSATSADDTTAALLRRLQALADETGGGVGLHALHVETGRSVGLREAEPFFMASVTKLPLAVAVLRGVEAGRFRLGDTVAISPAQMNTGRSPIREASPGGTRMTTAELIRYAVSESDNTANDALQRLLGGPAGVTRTLEEAGVRGIRVDRPYTRLAPEVTPPVDTADVRDTATPRGVTAMLAALQTGRLLNREHTAFLLDVLTRTANPPGRMVAGAPAGAAVAHKTGTWAGSRAPVRVVVNDVGLITLPGGRGHLAVALFVRNSPRSTAEVETAMAAITRAVVGHWTGDAGRIASTDGEVRIAADVTVRPLAPGLWLHVTTSRDGIPANGALLETADGGSVLFDAGWNDAHAAALLRWAADSLRRPVRRAFVTHSHRDRTGGLGALHARGVPVSALALTARLAQAAGYVPAGVPAPDSVPGLAAGPVRDADGFELRYPGAGHAPDNIVAYFPRHRVLLGGCLVKADGEPSVGNVADADVEEWPRTVARVQAAYPDARVVIPGHGDVGGPAALPWTARLIAEKGPAAWRALDRS